MEGWGGGFLVQMWKVALTGTVGQMMKLQRGGQRVHGGARELLVQQQRLQIFAEQGLEGSSLAGSDHCFLHHVLC